MSYGITTEQAWPGLHCAKSTGHTRKAPKLKRSAMERQLGPMKRTASFSCALALIGVLAPEDFSNGCSTWGLSWTHWNGGGTDDRAWRVLAVGGLCQGHAKLKKASSPASPPSTG
jgi:hypothetical protein